MTTIEAPEARTAEIETAREVDGRIAAQWDLYWEAMAPTDRLHRGIKDLEKSLRRHEGYLPRVFADNEDRTAREQASYDSNIAYYKGEIEKATAELQRIAAAAKPFAEAANKIDAEEYTGWKRFYLVQHIHRSTHCSSFRMGTRIGWLPKVSGLTEAEAVAEYGEILCTICFPSAPVAWTQGTAKGAKVACAGTGKFISEDMRRGMGGFCPDCGQFVQRASRYNLSFRKHFPKEAK